MASLQIGETKERTHFLMTGSRHRVFFLCNQMKQCVNCKVGPCTHTLDLEDSRNYHDLWDSVVAAGTLSKENLIPDFEQKFEKLYFSDDDYDWWEKESADAESD